MPVRRVEDAVMPKPKPAVRLKARPDAERILVVWPFCVLLLIVIVLVVI